MTPPAEENGSAEARSPRITTDESVPIEMTAGHADGRTSGSYTRISAEQRGVTQKSVLPQRVAAQQPD